MPLLLLYAAVVVGMRRYCWLAAGGDSIQQ